MLNTSMVSIETDTATRRRYEIGGEKPILTHECTMGERADIAPEVVEEFRVSPPAELRIEPICDTSPFTGRFA
jgi:hypothetical protein